MSDPILDQHTCLRIEQQAHEREQPAAHGSRVCRMEAPSDVVSAHRPPPYQVKGNPAKRTQRGSSVAAFPYCLPVASRTASLALPTPLRM
jgi:hypothetical protein